MSAAIEESDQVLEDRRERRLGETFMATVAAIGGLLLLDAGRADAALPDPTTQRPGSEAADPLHDASALLAEEILGPPAVSDSAFLEAITALSPPLSLTTDISPSTLGAAAPDPIAPPDDAPSAQPDDAANDAQFTLPGSIAVIGSAQLSPYAGAAIRTAEVAFSHGADTFNFLSGPAAPSLNGAATLAGEATQTLGGLGPTTQANGFDGAGGAQASLSGGSTGATIPGAGDRVGATSESATPSFASPAALSSQDLVIDLSALFAFGVVNPGALDLFAVPTFGGGDQLGFVGPDASVTTAGVDRVGVADFAARAQIRVS